MIVVRDAILTATIVALIFLAAHRPPIVQDNQVPYCVIDYLAGRKHPLTGEVQTAWAAGYGPCSLQDIYREIRMDRTEAFYLAIAAINIAALIFFLYVAKFPI